MSSFSRTQVMLSELVGKVLSESSLASFVQQLYSKLEKWEAWARDQLLHSPVLHADETGLNVNGQSAWVHLLREIQYVIEAHGHNWAKLMEKEYRTLQRRYRIAVTKGERECPELPASGKRGRTAKTKARNLLERFRDFEGEILRFAQEPIVPFTHNIAERELRMVKVKVNVSGYFRSESGARAFCRIRRSNDSVAERHSPYPGP